MKFKQVVVIQIFCIIITLIFFNCSSCSGKIAKSVSDCTSLSTLAYRCCYIEGSSILLSSLNYKFCYAYPAGTDPFIMLPPNTSPKLNINVLECGTPPPNTIKQTDLCGVDKPKNSTICYSFGSNCCLLNYNGYSACLDKFTFNADANGVVLECTGNNLYILLDFYFLFLLSLIFIIL